MSRCHVRPNCTTIFGLLPGIVTSATTTFTQATTVATDVPNLVTELDTVTSELTELEIQIHGILTQLFIISTNTDDLTALLAVGSALNIINNNVLPSVSTIQGNVTNITNETQELVDSTVQVQKSAKTTLNLAKQTRVLSTLC